MNVEEWGILLVTVQMFRRTNAAGEVQNIPAEDGRVNVVEPRAYRTKRILEKRRAYRMLLCRNDLAVPLLPYTKRVDEKTKRKKFNDLCDLAIKVTRRTPSAMQHYAELRNAAKALRYFLPFLMLSSRLKDKWTVNQQNRVLCRIRIRQSRHLYPFH
ncbi:hypothetical protein MTR_1671s0010 [Medicago truncatula]|uniref:Uncharacterized protein n=1 Tax=Medicago truncatula TaxID=3880 RepID=A0A072TDX8_MEDTR|nr:hypothetical protein MTR_1671s0010 [Medicago truncatula]